METSITRWHHLIETASAQLSGISEEASGRKTSASAWSAREILGHLVDSASNNHQRFVRAQMQSNLTFPAYEQNRWVACQDYQNESWSDLTALWTAYNKHLLHLIRKIPAERLTVPCVIGDGEPQTLGF